MSSHVVVIDSTARRAVVKVTPSTYLSDVLQQACKKLSLNPSQYGLKNNKRKIDISQPIRLAGLTSGAKLELELLSRSPSVVSVALQLPESEPSNTPNRRLVDKFPSTTSLWLILRKFESGVAGGAGSNFNFTARGVPQVNNGGSGAGRLYYETPVLQLMGRELSSFTELQKTLGQLGYNSGSTLIRLGFRTTPTPLDEAMVEIGQYFKEIDSHEDAGAHAGSAADTGSRPAAEHPALPEDVTDMKDPPEPEISERQRVESSIEGTTNPQAVGETLPDEEEVPDEETIVGPDQRPISVYAPPSNTTPQAATQSFDESDYIPTIEHAKKHQSRLSTSAQNVRLPSEAEIREQEAAAKQKLADIQSVELKIRYPDQSQVVSKFGAMDTTTSLYTFVRSMLVAADQPFWLSYASPKGPIVIPRDDGGNEAKKLISGLGFLGRMLITFVWDESASAEARLGPVLKEEFARVAKELRVEEAKRMKESEPNEPTTSQSNVKGNARGGDGGKKGMPKWLKLPGKK
ncbi:MAG: hypothetical protein M1833_003219 [Piccolia ochrophora]|nr:MAG: hypothetical protein M1833_003219 [Piccolia ochrophora]